MTKWVDYVSYSCVKDNQSIDNQAGKSHIDRWKSRGKPRGFHTDRAAKINQAIKQSVKGERGPALYQCIKFVVPRSQ